MVLQKGYATNGNVPKTAFDFSRLVQCVYKIAWNMNIGCSVSEQAAKGTVIYNKKINGLAISMKKQLLQ